LASIEKRGKNTYRITVSTGYDVTGKKIRKFKTVKLPEKMTIRQQGKELNRLTVLFEQEVQKGTFLDGEKITFAEFTEEWLKKYAEVNYAPAALKPCKARLKQRIIPEIGHIKLSKLQPHHLMGFYNQLSETGARLDNFYTPTEALINLLKPYQRSEIIKITGITDKTCQRIKKGEKTTLKTAKKICASFNIDFKKMFSCNNNKKLSQKTIKNHHGDISSILSCAEKWNLITFNPAKRVDLGKTNKRKAKYYDDKQVAEMIKALEYEPLQYKTMIYLTIDIGLRSGELCGLKWVDVDFEQNTITINKQRQYLSGWGVMERAPKTENGIRTVTLSSTAISILKQYRSKQLKDKLKIGSAWKNGDYIFLHPDGSEIHPSRPYKWFVNFLRRHELPKITFHELRHTNASLLISIGIDPVTLSNRLGHSDKNITLNTYSHVIKSKEAQVANEIDKLYSRINGR